MMGMYDELRCEFPLPMEGANDLLYQTKDTENQYLDLYVIRADGTLWVEEYDTVDRSDPNAEGLMRICGSMSRENKRWVQAPPFTGSIEFYTGRNGEWIEWSAYFVAGKLQSVNLVSPSPSTL